MTLSIQQKRKSRLSSSNAGHSRPTRYTLHYAPDNASLIIRLALEEIGAAYRTVLVDRYRAEQRSPEFLKLNPNGLIPVCIIDGEAIFETAAILLLLCERHEALAPSPGSVEHMHFVKWLVCLSNGLHADLRQIFYPSIYAGDDLATRKAHQRITRQRLNQRFAMFDTAVAGSDGVYLFGDEPTAIDIYLAVCLRWAQLYPLATPDNIDIGEFPALLAMAQALEARPAIQRGCAAEGMSMPAFTAPRHVMPPEGSAL
ncbi:MAG: glutathione S-transferase [Gammaproteobacteria bacterium]|nr:MAG: glutathione S-transferase [Gammaproteobacteria bacterium]